MLMTDELLRIDIQNFLSFGQRNTLQLDGLGLVLVEGENRMARKARSNGAGKSVLPEAIVWGGTGSTIRELSADGVINRRAKKNCLVEMYGRKRNGQYWTLTRGKKLDGKNILDFVFAGKNLTAQGDPKETQRQIHAVLGWDYKTLINTFVFNGQDTRWRFTSLTDAGQKEILDEILDLGDLDRALAYVRSVLERLRIDRQRVEGRIMTCGSIADSLKATLASQTSQRKGEIKAAIEELDEELESLPALERSTAAFVKRMKDKAASLARKVALVRKTIEIKGSRRTYLQGKRVRLKAEHSALLEKSKAALALMPGQSCGVCGSKISAVNVKKHAQHLKAEARGITRKIVAVVEEMRSNVTAVDENRLSKLIRNQRLVGDREEKIALQERLAEAREWERSKLLEKRAALVASLHKRSPVSGGLEEKIDKEEKRLVVLEAKLKRLKREQRHHEFWATGFGNAGVRSHYLDYVVPLLNDYAAKYSAVLLDDTVVRFDNQTAIKTGAVRDKFRVVVDNEQGADTYKGNSSGEKRKIDIVVARTLQRLQSARTKAGLNISFWDEVFDGLDETSSESVLQLLRAEAKQRSSVFVVTHLEWLKQYFNRVVTVIKDGGCSWLEVS